MRRTAFNSMGLGTAQTADLSATNIQRCSSAWYYLNPFSCWGMSQDAWAAAASLQNAGDLASSSVELAGPGTPSNLATPVTGNDPNAINDLITGLVNEQGLQQQANDVTAINDSTPDTPLGTQPCEYFGLSCTTLAIAAGIGVFALAAMGGGSPRRYGR